MYVCAWQLVLLQTEWCYHRQIGFLNENIKQCIVKCNSYYNINELGVCCLQESICIHAMGHIGLV